jgi:hypothetical protein
MYKPLSLPWPNSVTYSFVIVYWQCSPKQFIKKLFKSILSWYVCIFTLWKEIRSRGKNGWVKSWGHLIMNPKDHIVSVLYILLMVNRPKKTHSQLYFLGIIIHALSLRGAKLLFVSGNWQALSTLCLWYVFK